MKPLVRLICMRIIGIVFSVLGAIALAFVWLNMGSIMGMISGNPQNNQAESSEKSGSPSHLEAQVFGNGFSSGVSKMAKTSTNNIAVNKADVDDAAKKINALDKKMNGLIAKNHDLSYEHWSVADKEEFTQLENQKKVAINEYNAAAIKVNKSSSDIQSDVMGLLRSLIPSGK